MARRRYTSVLTADDYARLQQYVAQVGVSMTNVSASVQAAGKSLAKLGQSGIWLADDPSVEDDVLQTQVKLWRDLQAIDRKALRRYGLLLGIELTALVPNLIFFILYRHWINAVVMVIAVAAICFISWCAKDAYGNYCEAQRGLDRAAIANELREL